MKKYAHKIGAVLYALWGIVHILGGGLMLFTGISGGADPVLAMTGTALSGLTVSGAAAGLVGAILNFHSWNLLWLGGVSLVVAVTMNWKNSVAGYWINMAVVGASDLGLIFALLMPGYMAPSDGFIGPALWIGALIFSTLGVLNRRMPELRTRTA